MPNQPGNRWVHFADEWVVGRLCAGLVLLLTVLINLQVLFGLFRVGQVVEFGRDLLLLGRGITTNTLIDLQWHLLVLIAFLPMGLLVLTNGHVRVDVFYNRLSERGRCLVDICGHLLLSLPFLVLLIPAAWRFTIHAYMSGDGSSLGGLRDYYLIRFAVLAGLLLFTIAVVIDLARRVRALASRGT